MIVRPSRPFHSQPRQFTRARRAALIAASAASVLLGTSLFSNAMAQASAASAPVAASDAPAVTQYSVKPGQSLSDIATQITGSTDRATREKMSRALFDANPNAFMGHDPSRLKLGSVLNVPQGDGAASASAASGASAASSAPAPAVPAVVASSPATAAPVVTASAPETAAVPAEAASSSTTRVPSGAEVSGAVTASTASGASAASEAQPASGASEIAAASAPVAASVPASAPVASAVTPASTASSAPTSGNGPIGWIIGVVVAIGLLLIAMRASKRRRAVAVPEVDQVTPEPPVVAPAPQAPDTPVHSIHSHQATGAADLEGVAVQRGQGELNAVAASMENYDAAQAFDTPTEDTPLSSTEAKAADNNDDDDAAHVTLSTAVPAQEPEARRAPFMPDAPAALHRDFTPPRPGAVEAALAAERAATERAVALEQATREAVEREAKEAAAREAAEREAEAREAEKVAAEAREAEAREAEAREAATREAAAREASEREAAAREAEAREAAAREAAAREAASHATPPADHATTPHDDSYDEEPSSPASRLPQPKFPQEAIEALSALDFGLPPRQEAPLESPEPSPASKNAEAETQEIAPASITPQPIADPAVFDQQNEQHRHPDASSDLPAASAAEQIETGTAGAASVAGLGASRFGPLSLDFDYNSPSSQTEPLPAFTPEQIATIARNKLELAVEYIELGDLSGARTLLQEVIDSNDAATRQPAATLLSTLAPLS
ncbi:FimV/HubP family polar landmark protein [Caballeronia sordidicola]|uniref:TolA protein n=1 Tax=Caballeronia sordidicola TaxID=196367 RepID=A0A2C9XVA8_CABSO|nr:FimV/HubP family polar landmark protein [Caballeronia sordidicola]OTP74251.1 TolA protein [Caballeronia sordidicola]